MAAVSYLGTIKELQGLTSREGGPFGRPAWFELLEASGHNAVVAVAQDGDAKLALPLRWIGRRRLGSLTNWYAFRWTSLATGDGDEQDLLRLAAWAISRAASRITLDKLTEADAVRMAAAFRAAGWWVTCERIDTNHYLPVGGRSFAEYLAARPGAVRTALKRKAGKVSVEILTDFHSDAWHAYEEVYRDSWKPAEGDPPLLRRFAELEGTAGRLRLGLARAGGEVVAAQFWTVEDGTAYIHKLAHRDRAKGLSPGTTLTAALFEHAIDRDRVTRIDFGTGDDPYKRDWMEQARPLYRFSGYYPSDLRVWPALGKAALRELVSRMRRP